MANYGYGYGNFTSQPQQYSAGNYGSQSTGSYGYASTQPVSRVVQGFQQTGNTGYYTAPAQAPVPAAATSGGYGYFQRASDTNTAYVTTQKSNYATTQGYSKPQAYVAASPASSSYSQGYSSAAGQQKSSYSTPSYNSAPYQKPKPASASSKGVSHQNAYEKVVYNAATSFLTQQAQSSKGSWQKSEKPTFKLPNQKGSWPSRNSGGPPKPQQLHYCEVCKISCAGPQTYKEHLDGQKHKKKAASQTSDTKNLPPGTYKCELCEVICTGKDAFTAHVKGAAHMKTLKLHQKLGKPIPEIKLPESKPAMGAAKINVVKTTAPKINFVGGTKLTTTGEEKIEKSFNTDENFNSQQEVPTEGEAIGEEHVEDIKSDIGKVIGFKCTICDCRFNDVVAKIAHVKGRRHRVSYKKKVDPSTKVEGNGRSGRSGSRGSRNSQNSEEMVWKQRQQEQMRWEQQLRLREDELRRWEHEEFMRRASEDRYWTRPDRNRMHELEFYEWERREKFSEPQNMYGPPQGPPPPTADDKLIMAKHNDIYPTENELKQVQTIVAAAEKALKLVSDTIGEEDAKAEEKVKPAVVAEVKTEVITGDKKPEPLMKVDNQQNRKLKGIMRVGALAKGLLLKGQLSVELVVICAEKTTYTLLKRVGKLVPEKLKEAAPNEKYNMQISTTECAIFLSSVAEPKCMVKVFLTSPAMRDEEDELEKKDEKSTEVKKEPTVVVDPKDVLDKEKALQALAALRHAKWFQARANQLQSCVITIRIFRDMCNRVPAFKPLKEWAIELLCEKALGSSFKPLTPGEAFRRVLEAISSGILLPGGTGLLDPCEKDKTDAVSYMNTQEREDMTAAAQHALRLTSFRQLHKILGIEALKPNPNRKRPAPPVGSSDAPENKVVKKEGETSAA